MDVVYSRSEVNLERVVDALRPVAPYLRGAPPGLPFEWSVETLRRGLNFTLTTQVGDIDLLGELVGGANFDTLAAHSEQVELFGHVCLSVDLPELIRLKRAAGRPKDLEALVDSRPSWRSGSARGEGGSQLSGCPCAVH